MKNKLTGLNKHQIMKPTAITILLLFTFTTLAEGKEGIKEYKAKVYNLEGKKMDNSWVDSLGVKNIYLRNHRRLSTIPVEEIGFITISKGSGGLNVIIGMLIGAGAGAVIANNAAGSFLSAESTIAGMLTGALVGAIIGTTTISLKEKNKFSIKGDSSKWDEFRKAYHSNFKEKNKPTSKPEKTKTHKSGLPKRK